MSSDVEVTPVSQPEEADAADETVDIRASHEEAAEEAVTDVVEAEVVTAEIEVAEEEAVGEATEVVVASEAAKAEIDAAEEEAVEEAAEVVVAGEAAKAEIDAAEEAAVDEAIADAEQAGDDAAEEAAADAAIDAALIGEAAKAEIDAAEEEAVEEAAEVVVAGEAAKAEIDAAEEAVVEETVVEVAEAELLKAEVAVIEEAAAEEAVVEIAAAEADQGDAETAEAADETPSMLRGPGEWYVVHTYAGYENKVKANLGSRIQSMQMEEKIFDVVIPMEDVMEIKGGKKQVVQKKVFPGYLLVRMVYDNDSWYVVRNTPGVTGFVSSGTGTKPTPLSAREVEKILAVKKETAEKPQYRLEFEEGDVVRIIVGPFADFTGTISEINIEQSKLKVMVNIFDRETPVELAFDQVAKA